MKHTILLSLVVTSTLLLSGCNKASQPTINENNDSPYSISEEFSKQFSACQNDPSSCSLDRDLIIEGTITKIYDSNIGDLSNFVDILDSQGGTSTIPLLPDSQQKRSTIIINASGDIIPFEDITVGDKIKASVKSFDIVEANQVLEKLGQYGYIQITAQ